MTPDDKKESSFLRSSNETLGFVVGILTSITFILSQIKYTKFITDRTLLVSIDILNIIVLLIALISLKPSELALESNEVKKAKNRLPVISDETLLKIQSRANILVKQLVHCIRWFIIILGFFYLFQLIADTTQMPYYCLKKALDSNRSFFDLITSNSYFKIQAEKYLSIELLTNTTNLFSAAYLILAFQVLFSRTLEEDDKTWDLKGYIPFSIAILITLANVLFILTGVGEAKLGNISHMIRLAGGIYNGVAMLLLFSRFISMEYFFQRSTNAWQTTFYKYGIVLGLPLYVVAQPLYGLFNAVEIGESAVIFKSIVFLVCFWGKLVFLLFVYTMLNKKWIHSYLMLVLSQENTITGLADDVEGIENL